MSREALHCAESIAQRFAVRTAWKAVSARCVLKDMSGAYWTFKAFRFFACPVVLFWAVCSISWAQLNTSATISGTVTDASDAVVPDATVTITNQETKVSATTQSTGSGTYVMPNLPVGTYTVAVSKNGFQNFTEANVILHPATVATVNAVLQLGSVGTAVTVEASAAEVQTSTSENAHEVSSVQVSTLPLNGRNYQALAVVIPGVVNTSAGSSLGPGGRSTNNVLSINGGNTNTTFYALDGIWNENTGNMAQTTVTPNPDSIEEVRVLQNNYSPKYSLMGASVVLLQTKSGTSEFHGALWEYFRNNDLNARNFFSATVPTLKQNIFGYTLGGPLYIPKVYNTKREKTFFFLTENWVVSHAGSVLLGQDPTADMRNGAFPTPIHNPATGINYPRNAQGEYVIPPSQINTSAQAMLNALYPLPNYPGTLNYLNSTPQITNQRDDELKIDHNFSDRYRVTLELLDEKQDLRQTSLNQSNTGSIFPTNYEDDLTKNYLGQLQFTATITPSMVNTASISANIYNLDLILDGIVYRNQIPGFNQTLPINGALTNRLPLITFSQGYASEGIPAARPLFHAADLDETAADNWSWLRGKHYIEAGLAVVISGKRQNVATADNGQFSFTGQFTGNAVADYLLGDAATFTQQSSERRVHVLGNIVSPYVQDRFQVTRRLTWTIGTRITYMPLPHAPSNFETIFVPSAYSAAQAPIVNTNGTIVATPNYNPLNGLVRNAAGGIPDNFSGRHNWYVSPMTGFALDVFGDGKTALRGGYSLTYTRIFTNQDCSFNCASNPPDVTSVNLINANFSNPAGTGTTRAASAPTLTTADLNIQATQVHTYSLTLEHQFWRNWTGSVTGAGALARHLVGTFNQNQPLPFGAYDFNPLINTGRFFTYLYGAFPGYAAINDYTTQLNSSWNALEALVTHPVSSTLFFTGAYTWSHNLGGTVVGGYDYYNPNRWYGNSALNVPQVLTVSAVWTLPWLQHATGFKGIFGGWRYSDVTTIRSGMSFSPGLSISNQGIAVRPNVVGVSVTGPQTVAQWFNKADFVAPAPGYFGNAGTGVIRGPHLIDFDMALYKDFRLAERYTVQFRAELFNIFNHPNFTALSLNYGSQSFGQVTSAADPRIAEFALRFHF